MCLTLEFIVWNKKLNFTSFTALSQKIAPLLVIGPFLKLHGNILDRKQTQMSL